MAVRFPEVIDTHAHVSGHEFRRDRDEVIARAGSAGVGFIEVGFDIESSKKAVELAGSAALAAAVGIHPHNASDYAQDLAGAWKDIEDLLKAHALADTGAPVAAADRPRIVAIGEIGLDYYRDLSPRDLQARCFEMGLNLAISLELPVIIHEREAEEDTVDILKGFDIETPVIFHCFSGNLAFARCCLDLGGYLGLGGMITYPKNSELRDLLKFIPTNRMLLETDAPYLTPQSRRGHRNEPFYVLETRDVIAASLGADPSVVAKITRDNAISALAL